MSDNIFVLDIGTRTVMALLASLEKDGLIVRHLIFKEHRTRSMLDGQIHDVGDVASLIAELLEEMQTVSGEQLNKVSVAAAGRSLKTVRGKATINYPVSTIIKSENHVALELQAVQAAQDTLPKNLINTPLSQQYYCVGYSIIEERLDGIRLSSIIGQTGQAAEIEVVATFLPRIVVDSLQNSVEMAGLELASITLEPIAVANLVLNPTMRRLNLVLVDIGAGTSDIAICGGDSISAFGMVPMAGDEITEALSDNYLVDFHKAEEAKRKLDSTDQIQLEDVLGFEQCLVSNDVIRVLEPAVKSLAEAISGEILELNGKAPQAVLLVGGGSLTPGLPNALAESLNIPLNRVAVQQAGRLELVGNLPEEFKGPNFITVLGIAFTSLKSPTLGFITVTINDKPVRLLNLARNFIAEAIMAGGYNLKDIYGRPGLALSCELNGELYTVPGKPGIPGTIKLNDEPAGLKDQVKDGDIITFVPGTTGENARGTFREILKDLVGNCTINNKVVELNPVIKIGNNRANLEDEIKDGCRAQIETELTIRQLLKRANLFDDSMRIIFNNNSVSIFDLCTIKKNGKRVSGDEKVVPGDHFVFELPQNMTVGDFLPREEIPCYEIWINGIRTLLNRSLLWVNRIPADKSTPVKYGDIIEYKPGKPDYRPILIDVFNEINFSPRPPAGKTRFILKVNEEETEYTYVLKNGDKVQIAWV